MNYAMVGRTEHMKFHSKREAQGIDDIENGLYIRIHREGRLPKRGAFYPPY